MLSGVQRAGALPTGAEERPSAPLESARRRRSSVVLVEPVRGWCPQQRRTADARAGQALRAQLCGSLRRSAALSPVNAACAPLRAQEVGEWCLVLSLTTDTDTKVLRCAPRRLLAAGRAARVRLHGVNNLCPRREPC